MKTKEIEMPEVTQCSVDQCAYNKESSCHARAITVGDINKHLCDTSMTADRHTQRQDIAGVGACRSTDCVHNEDFECQADAISVMMSGNEAECGTFSAG